MSTLHDVCTFVISQEWKQKTAKQYLQCEPSFVSNICVILYRERKNANILIVVISCGIWIVVISCGGISGYFYFLLHSFFNFPITSAINMCLYSKKEKKSIIFKVSTSICTVLPRLCEKIFTYLFIKSRTQLSDLTITSKNE